LGRQALWHCGGCDDEGLAMVEPGMLTLDPSYPAQHIRPALLQERVGRQIRCLTCERRCEIAPGGQGWCRTRQHQDGQLVTLIYGAVSSLSANPIEKKPLYHFYPAYRFTAPPTPVSTLERA